MKARARGRKYDCCCREEWFRVTRGAPVRESADGKFEAEIAQLDGWTYLLGECGGGVRLRIQGVKVLAAEPADKVAADRARAATQTKLARRDRDPYAELLESLSDEARARAIQLESALRQRASDIVIVGVEIGGLLLEAKRIFGYRGFGVFLARIGLDRFKAFRAMEIARVVQGQPRFFELFKKLGQEKIGALVRLPEAKQVEVLERGVPVNGVLVAAERVPFRDFNRFVQSVVGKSPRGRKSKAEPAAKRAERFGLPIEIIEAFQKANAGLMAIKASAKSGWEEFTPSQRRAVGRLWMTTKRLFFALSQPSGLDLDHVIDRGRS